MFAHFYVAYGVAETTKFKSKWPSWICDFVVSKKKNFLRYCREFNNEEFWTAEFSDALGYDIRTVQNIA